MKTTTLKRYMIAKTLWRLACAYDGLPNDPMFIAFSASNPWSVKLNEFNADDHDIDVIGFRLAND
jgi:hypothetical protein